MRIAFSLAGASISISITLNIIDLVIRKNREKEWEKVKIITYMAIMEHIIFIANEVPIHGPIDWTKTNKYIDIICTGVVNPSEKAAIAMIELASEIEMFLDKRRTQLLKEKRERVIELDFWERQTQSESEWLIDYYYRINWRIRDIRSTLIPRVLQLSDNQEVNQALLRFESLCRYFEDAIKEQESCRYYPTATHTLCRFLKESPVIYDTIRREIPTSGGQLGYS